MRVLLYECRECGALTSVREWPATRYEPADSTHGDGCSTCGGDLRDDPAEVEHDAPTRADALDHGAGGGDPDEGWL